MAKKIKSVKKSSTPTLTASVGTPTINRTIRLEAKDYIGAQTPKDLIVLHHTVGATAKSTIDYWKSDAQRIATAFVVERNGETLSPSRGFTRCLIRNTGRSTWD